MVNIFVNRMSRENCYLLERKAFKMFTKLYTSIEEWTCYFPIHKTKLNLKKSEKVKYKPT